MNDCFKDEVEKAIGTQRDIVSEDSQFAVSLKLDECLFNEISIHHMNGINIPVSLDDVAKLVEVASKSNPKRDSSLYVKHEQIWQINECEALNTQSCADRLPKLTHEILLLMGLNPSVLKIKTILRHFFICGTDGFAKFHFNEDNAGFVKMIVQIPVEGGHEEGRIKVELNDQIRLFNVSDGSHHHYHLTAFYSDCDYQLEKVTFGWRLAMVFDVILEKPTIPIPLSTRANLKSFLATAHIQQVLTKWTPTGNNYPNMLALVLDHRYTSSDLSFHSLKGRDRRLAELLQSVDTIDTYLTNIQKHGRNLTLSDEEDSQEESSTTDHSDSVCVCCVAKGCICQSRTPGRPETQTSSMNGVKILSLTGDDDQILDCIPIDVDLDSELILVSRNVCNIRTNVTVFDCENMEYDIADSHAELDVLRWLLEPRAVLIIFPKNSLNILLLGNFTAALDQFEMHPDINTLNQVITFCQDYPERVWIDAKDREERTRRLVSFCFQLGAKTEGLMLLEILGSDFPGREPTAYEGIRNKAIAIEIANLTMVIGWKQASTVCMEKLLSFGRIKDQMEYFAHFALAFVDLGLPEIFKNIGNRLVALLQSKALNVFSNLTVPAIVACTAMVFRMQQFEGAGLFRIYSLGIELKSLPLQQLFPVIEGIQKTCNVYLENDQLCQRLQRELHRHLLSSDIPDELAVGIMLFYLDLNDAILLKELTQTIINQKHAIQSIVSSPEIWNKALKTLAGKWALKLLVNIRINHLEMMTIPIFTWNQNSTAFITDSSLDNYFHSSSVRHVVSGFNNRHQAERWVERFFGPDQVNLGHSADVDIVCEDSVIACVITKNRGLHWHHLNMFQQSRAELLALRDRRRRRLAEDICGTKVIETSRSHSISSETSSTVSATKRPRSGD